MPYLGNAPAEAYSNISYQDLTGGSGTTFTLDFPAGSPGELEVFVNNVRQEPSVAYTVSGTTLTMTGTIATTDDVYVVFQGKAQQTVRHPANTAIEATSGTFSGAVSISGGISNLIRVQTFTSSGTYTKSSGATKALVYVCGGGGGGGGVDGQGSSTGKAGGGGAAGGVAIKLITSGLGATETVTVGSGGSGGTTSTGSAGGTSSFGSHCSATGGAGGAGGQGVAFSQATMAIGGKGGIGSNGDVNIRGGSGQFGISAGTSASENSSGEGGDCFFGGGAQSIQGDNTGRDADSIGGGGSGGSTNNTTANYGGGDGADGIVIVYEYL